MYKIKTVVAANIAFNKFESYVIKSFAKKL